MNIPDGAYLPSMYLLLLLWRGEVWLWLIFQKWGGKYRCPKNSQYFQGEKASHAY
jgi:hypothetical protein